MKYKYLLIVLFSSFSLISTAFSMATEVEEQPNYTPMRADNGNVHSPEQFRNTMVELLEGIEEASGLNDDASRAFIEATPEDIETIYGFWGYKNLFFEAVPNVVEQIELAKERSLTRKLFDPKTETASKLMQPSAASSPVYPDYPTGAAYTLLEALGLVSVPGQRCGGQALENYKAAMFGAETAIFLGEAACSAAGCDPSGAICISICGPVELVKIGVEAAVLPLKLCKDLDGDIDSAEISADYENGVSILSDLATHDGNLSLHDTRMESQLSIHDGEIKDKLDIIMGNQDTIIANQTEIIKLLKTPEGKRPGWNKDGY
jgi:hypothetical protein